jgi:catechol 2,3-dioxygenase-like lactoylglutathione lyase family enzyme
MAHIVAPEGSALGMAVIGSRSLEASLEFYVGQIGFSAGPITAWAGGALERWWTLPEGSTARTCLLTASACEVGRVLLIEFASDRRKLVQATPNSQAIGLANLNFYTADARAAVERLRKRGYTFWTEPTQHSLDAGVGNPIEVIFDGPDGVAMNLVELTSTDPATRIGQMRAYVEKTGYTRHGFTPVVTTSHIARSIDRCCEFYEKVCGMGRLFEDEMHADHVNAFLRIPAGGRTRIVFMQGNHMYGKIAVSKPVNYLEQCVDLQPTARAPNIGYLAQVFEVRDLERSLEIAAVLGSRVVIPRMRVDLPGTGERDQAMVRNPGSGALMWLAQRER